MKNYGRAFRYFRINRHYSLEKAAKDALSVSQLSRFERGESDISLEKFFQALDNINVTVEEFMHAARDFKKHEIIDIMSKCITYHYERKISGFEELQDKLKSSLVNEPCNKFIKRNIILIEGFICQCDFSRKMPKEYLDEISDYLFITENWDVHELILIGNLFEFFSTKLLYNIAKELSERKERLIAIGTTSHLLIIALLNIYLEFSQRDEFEKAKFVKDNFVEVMPNETKSYERIIFLYCNGFYDYRMGDNEGISKMKKAIEIFEILDSKNLANNYIEHFEKYVKQI